MSENPVKPNYANPKVPCPNCGKEIPGSTKLKIGLRVTDHPGDTLLRVLDRYYICSCGWEFWHEVAAKEEKI